MGTWSTQLASYVSTHSKNKDAKGPSTYTSKFTRTAGFHNILTLKFSCFYEPNQYILVCILCHFWY